MGAAEANVWCSIRDGRHFSQFLLSDTGYPGVTDPRRVITIESTLSHFLMTILVCDDPEVRATRGYRSFGSLHVAVPTITQTLRGFKTTNTALHFSLVTPSLSLRHLPTL
jgi:hypothetical protein